MDVDAINFQSLLPSILQKISSSRFVSLDLELSGIPSLRPANSRKVYQDDSGKQSLQQRYAEVKDAAERFQVLQLGLTCVEEDVERGIYTCSPYNFWLSPIVDRRLKVEREFSYQSGAVDFLLGHNFRMQDPFLRGVPYLSFNEEKLARAQAETDLNSKDLPDIGIKAGDEENFELMGRTRQLIDGWKESDFADDFLTITPEGHEDSDTHRGLNGYQKRLVHQLVRAEYPDLVSFSKADCVQVTSYDADREGAQAARKRYGVERTISQQVGLRLVVEALVSHLDEFPKEAAGNGESLEQNGHAQLPMLVGHNFFLDLIYLYACFLGELPDIVEDFQRIVARHFPSVVDTKYLADILNQNSPRYRSSLEEIDAELFSIASPTIEIPPDFSRYATSGQLHEAGFDSFLTARVLIRLSTKMQPRRIMFDIAPPDSPSPSPPKSSRRARKKLTVSQAIDKAHATTNIFEHLSIDDPGPAAREVETRLLMPHAAAEFWQTYGNKLRANGTVEGFCALGEAG